MKSSILRYRATGYIKNSFGKKIVSSKSFIPILFAVSIILLSCLHVWQRVYVIGLVQEVSHVEKENKILTDKLKKAEIEKIELSRLSRIEKVANEKFGLEKTGARNLFTLQLDGNGSEPEGIGEVITSLKKIADNFPVLNETKAETIGVFELDEK
jgi:cell division protein FtsL